jgi:hypothetical protein
LSPKNETSLIFLKTKRRLLKSLRLRQSTLASVLPFHATAESTRERLLQQGGEFRSPVLKDPIGRCGRRCFFKSAMPGIGNDLPARGKAQQAVLQIGDCGALCAASDRLDRVHVTLPPDTSRRTKQEIEYQRNTTSVRGWLTRPAARFGGVSVPIDRAG